MITSSRFTEVAYDWELSLYPDSANNIVGKSFVIRQGNNEADYRCSTIKLSSIHSQRPGAIPCEKIHYADCLVGTAKDDVCIYRPCTGYRRFWGTADAKTRWCAQIFERFPKRLRPGVAEGAVACRHGKYTLLKPIDDGSLL